MNNLDPNLSNHSLLQLTAGTSAESNATDLRLQSSNHEWERRKAANTWSTLVHRCRITALTRVEGCVMAKIVPYLSDRAFGKKYRA